MLVLGFPEYRAATERLAAALDLPCEIVAIHRFPDGESLLRAPAQLPERVILCRSLFQPNDKLVELCFLIEHLRDQGVRQILLVAPYLGYMRQDKAFHPGEVVSQRAMGKLLARGIDGIFTVDAHLHRTPVLSQAVPVDPAVNLTATEPMAAFLEGRLDNPLLVGPDEESRQWVAAIAAREGLDFEVARKTRLGDREVRIELPDFECAGRHLVLVDDVASTGRTLEATARALAPRGPASLSVLVTHALFVGDALDRLADAGVERIWSCDSIPHPTNVVHLDALLAGALRPWVENTR